MINYKISFVLKFREHALQMVMFALMTFPSSNFDTKTCIASATYAALNRKRRVRQAALDVFAILAKMISTRTVIEVVEGIVATRDDGKALLAALQARLARKQLPLVTADGLVQYSLRIPSPSMAAADDENLDLSADIEWIIAGIGSVSPTSLKRRSQCHQSSAQQSFCCLSNHCCSDHGNGSACGR